MLAFDVEKREYSVHEALFLTLQLCTILSTNQPLYVSIFPNRNFILKEGSLPDHALIGYAC